jgi:predicted ATPase
VNAWESRPDRPVRRVERDPTAEWDAHAWWADLPAVRSVLESGLDLPAGVTFLVGENGSGKSTLVEALAEAYGLNVEGGSRGAMHRTRPTESGLGGVIRLVRNPGRRRDAYFLRAETTHGMYTYLEALHESPDTDLHDRSHGEGFLTLLERKFTRPGFYLLDEPEAALSFTSTVSLISRLSALAEAGGTGRRRDAFADPDRAAARHRARAWPSWDQDGGVVRARNCRPLPDIPESARRVPPPPPAVDPPTRPSSATLLRQRRAHDPDPNLLPK